MNATKRMHFARFTAALGALGLAAAASLGAACQSFVAPPEPAIDGLQSGVLSDVNAPLRLRFSKPIDPATLRVKVVKLEVDNEGNLPDERPEPVDLAPLYSHDPDDGDKAGKSSFEENDQSFVITPLARFPVGTKSWKEFRIGARRVETRFWWKVREAWAYITLSSLTTS